MSRDGVSEDAHGIEAGLRFSLPGPVHAAIGHGMQQSEAVIVDRTELGSTK